MHRPPVETIRVGVPAFCLLLFCAPCRAEVGAYAFPGTAGTVSGPGFQGLVTAGETTTGSAESPGFRSGSGLLATVDTQAPTGSLLGAQGIRGQNAEVVAVLQDNVGISRAFLTYIVGGGTPRDVDMTPVTGVPGRWQGVVPAADVTERGIQYFVTAWDGFVASTFPPDAPDLAVANLPVRVTNLPFFELPSRRYELLGAPIEPDDADPRQVFDELGAYDTRNWRYGTFDGTGYDEVPNADDADPGQGFWIIAGAATPIRVSGTSTPLDRNFRITLNAGWNQIANPFAFPVDFEDVILPAGVENNLVGWDATAGGYENGQVRLDPRRGYFLRNNGAAGAVLEIPPVGSGVTAPSVRPDLRPAEEEGWSMAVAAEAGRFRDHGVRLGARAGAAEGKDPFDLSHAPPPPEGFVQVSLRGEDGDRLLSDFRSPAAEGLFFTLILESDRAGENYAVRFLPDPGPPPGWRLVALDETGAFETDLLEDGLLEGKVASDRFTRTWHVLAGSADFVSRASAAVQEPFLAGFTLHGPSPNPIAAGAGTSVSLALAGPAEAALRVFDLGGGLVRTLFAGDLPRGVHRFTWNGRDEQGVPAAAGIYFVRAAGSGFREVRKLVVLR